MIIDTVVDFSYPVSSADQAHIKVLQWLTAAYRMLLGRASDQRTYFTWAQVPQWAIGNDITLHFHISCPSWAAGVIERYNRLLKIKMAYVISKFMVWVWVLPMTRSDVQATAHWINSWKLKSADLHIRPTEKDPKVIEGDSILQTLEPMGARRLISVIETNTQKPW